MKLSSLRSRRLLPKKPPRRLEVERLEDRTVPASLSYSSYLPSMGVATAVDGSGNIYLTGNGWDGSGVFVAKLNVTGTALDWITNIGSSGVGTSIAVDASGDVYVAGYGMSGLPITANALATTSSTTYADFLSVLTPGGSGLLYSTYLPGGSYGSALKAGQVALAIDHAGDPTGSPDNVYLTGMAQAGFPTTPGAFQPSFPGGTPPGCSAFFAKIDPNLSGTASLVYGSYLGGTLNAAGVNGGNDGCDAGTGIAVDSSGNAYVTGRTASTNFPRTPGASQTTFGGGLEDAFIAKFNPSLSGAASLVYSTYLGGNGYDGSYTEYPHVIPYILPTPGPGIAVDSAGDAYVTGTTTSTTFPTTPGAFQTAYNANAYGEAFVTKLNATGTGLVYSTYLGGSYNTGGTAIAVDASGNAYVTGWTRSSNFPTENPIQAQKGSGVDEQQGFATSSVFVSTLNSSGTRLLFSTFYGGPGGTINKKGVFTGSEGDVYGFALALDSAGDVYVAGSTGVAGQPGATSFPTTAGAYDTTPGGGLLFKIDPPVDGAPASVVAAQPAPDATGATNGNSSRASLGTPGTALSVPAFDAGSLGLAWWLTPTPLTPAPSAGPTESPAPFDDSSTPAPTAGQLTQPAPVDLVASAHAPAAVDALFADLGPGLPLGDLVNGPAQA